MNVTACSQANQKLDYKKVLGMRRLGDCFFEVKYKQNIIPQTFC